MRLLCLFITFFLIGTVTADELLPTKIVSAEVVHVDYFHAQIEAQVFLGTEPGFVFACSKVSQITNGCSPIGLKPGNNTLLFESSARI